MAPIKQDPFLFLASRSVQNLGYDETEQEGRSMSLCSPPFQSSIAIAVPTQHDQETCMCADQIEYCQPQKRA